MPENDGLKNHIEIFISYAPEDKAFRDHLVKHLKYLQSLKIIDLWDDQAITAGTSWRSEIKQHLEKASIILLLMSPDSPDFTASEDHMSTAIDYAINRHLAGKAYIIPILLRPIYLGEEGDELPINKLKFLPTNQLPIVQWPDRDAAFVGVVTEIRRTVKFLRSRLQQQKIALFGYETQDRGGFALWKNPGDFVPNDEYQRWFQEKRAFRESEIRNTTWIKVGDHGYSHMLDFLGKGKVRERPLFNQNEERQGTWVLLGSGILKVTIDEYELDIYANRYPPMHSGIEFRNGLQTPYAYFVALPLQESEKEQYLEKSLSAFEQLLLINPGCAAAYQAQGDTFLHLKRYQEALEAYEHAISRDASNAQHYESQGWVLYLLERYDEALEAYMQTLQRGSPNAKQYNMKGIILRKLGRFDEALAAHDLAIQLSSHPDYFYIEQGITLRDYHRYGEAIQAFEQALLLTPTYAEAYNERGMAYREMRDYQKALADIDQALALQPKYIHAYKERGITLYEQGPDYYEEALTAFNQALERDHTYADAYVRKGKTLYGLLRYKEALDAYERARSLGYDLSQKHYYTIVKGLSALGVLEVAPQEHHQTPDTKGYYWHYPEKSVHWSPETGVHATQGEIRGKWADLGWEQSSLGYPISKQRPTKDSKGLFQHFQGGSIFWSAETGAHVVDGAVREKWEQLDWERGLLGYPLTDVEDLPRKDGRHCHFQRGCIYWSLEPGAHEVHGEICEKWENLGWEQGFLGFPVHDEKGSPDGVGRISNFQGGSIYWHPRTGAHAVSKDLYNKWGSLGWERGVLGYPVVDEHALPDSLGRISLFERGALYRHPNTHLYAVYGKIWERWSVLQRAHGLLQYPLSDQELTANGEDLCQHFQGGVIFWSVERGAREVYGAIWATWKRLNCEQGMLGYPTTGEMGTADRKGRYNHFQHGSIYYHPEIDGNVHEIYGTIHEKWASLGWEQSFLGYPITGERDAPGGRMSYFQHGAIYSSESEGTVVLKGSGRTLQKRFEDPQTFAFALEQARKQKPGVLSMVVYHIDHPGEKNVGYYRIGGTVDANGAVAGEWGKPLQVRFLHAQEHQGTGIALVDLDESGLPALLIFRIDHDKDKNRGYYRVRKALQADGTIAGDWSKAMRIPDPFGEASFGAGVACVDLNKSGRPDLLIFYVIWSGDTKKGFYRIGRDVDIDGLITGGWREPIAVPGDFGDGQNCVSIVLADLDGNGHLDLLLFYLKGEEDGNHGYYRVGKCLNDQGLVTDGWGEPVEIPGLFGRQTQAASIAVTDLKRNGRVDLLIFYIEHFSERSTDQNSGYYRVGRNLDTNGYATGGWSAPLDVPGWFGSWSQGAGIAFTTLL